MEKILDKIGSYNLFNFLLPGVVFVVALKLLTGIDLIQEDLAVGAFFYYFIGLVISRIGSLLIEPFAKWIGFVKFEAYADYLDANKEDSKVETFVEASNSYRTLAAGFGFLLIILLILKIKEASSLASSKVAALTVFALFVLFIFSYRKQTKFISKRIRKITNGK